MEENITLSKTEIIQWIVLVLISLLFLVIPNNEFYTAQTAKFLTISVFCIGLVCFGLVNIYVPAFLMPAAYVLSGVANWQSAMSGWTNSLPGIIFGAFIISNALERCGLIRRMAYYAVLKTKGSYAKLCYAILVVGWIASLMTSCNAHMIIIAVGICKALDFEKFDLRAAGIFMAVALGTISSEQWQYYPSPMSILAPALMRVDPSAQVRWIDNILYCWPMALYSALYLGIVIKFFVPKSKPVDLNIIRSEYLALGNLSRDEKKMTVFMFLFVGLLVSSTWTGMDIFVPFMLISVLLFFPGIKLAGEAEVQKVPYAMIVLISSCMSMGAIANSLGISSALSSSLLPVFKELGLGTAVTAFWSIMAGLNVILTPVAIYSAFGETFMMLFQQIGINPHSVMFLSVMGGDAIFLPHEHMFYLVIFSFGLISMKTFIKLWLIKLPFHLACILLIQLPYWKLIGFI